MSELFRDRVKYHKDVGDYFRHSPEGDFTVFDSSLRTENSEMYNLYTDIDADTLVIKTGSFFVSHRGKGRQSYNMRCISDEIRKLRDERGMNILVVTSGAVKLGERSMRYRLSDSSEHKRACAFAGQKELYRLWDRGLVQKTREVLVTHEDVIDEKRNEELADRYSRHFSKGRVPVVNEHDANSIYRIEITKKGERAFRDNDDLARFHAQLLKKAGYKPALVILTDTDGVYTEESFSTGFYTPIRIVKNSSGIESQSVDMHSNGNGGMRSKVRAASEAADDGVYTVIANGQYCNHDGAYQKGRAGAKRKYSVLDSILDGKVAGTRFMPRFQE